MSLCIPCGVVASLAISVPRSFNDLSELLDPGKPSRTDKVSIIADAIKAITQLRAESHQMKQLNKFLEVCSPSSTRNL